MCSKRITNSWMYIMRCWKVKEICAETNFSSMDEKVFQSQKRNTLESLHFLRETCVKLEDPRTQITLPWNKPNFLYKLFWTININKYSCMNRPLKNFYTFHHLVDLHWCQYIIATSLFYEVNDPLLQVCYKP